MAKQGYSLFGFLDEPEACRYLNERCVLLPTDDVHHLWEQARQNLGGPMSQAGHPDIQDMPAQFGAYVPSLQQHPRFVETMAAFAQRGIQQVTFKLVEIEPLLAYQIHIEDDRLPNDFVSAQQVPLMDEVIHKCLPLANAAITHQITPGMNSLFIVTEDMNSLFGLAQPHVDGMNAHIYPLMLCERSPFVQVARFNGRCFLLNGYHRAYRLRKAGITHIPSIFVEAGDFGQLGIEQGATFSRQALESDAPPTLGHFTQNRGVKVILKSAKTYYAVSWQRYDLLAD